MNIQNRSVVAKWVAGAGAALLVVGVGLWAYETGKAPVPIPSAPHASSTGSGVQASSSGPAVASGSASSAAPKKGTSSGTGSAVPCSALGLAHAQDAANAAAAGRNIAAHYGVSPWTAGLAGIAYRCNLIGAAGVQRSYGFFLGDAASGTKYSWYDNGSPSVNQYTKNFVPASVAVLPASGWSMGSADAIADFLKNGGAQYYRTMLPQSSAVQLSAGLSMSSGVPVWNVSIETRLPSGAPGPMFSRAYNAVTGAYCGSSNCSS